MKKPNEICFVDVHCHVEMIELPLEQIIENAVKNGVNIMIAQGVNSKSNRKVLEIASEYKEIKVALGLYPIDALFLSEKEIDDEIDFIKKNKDKIVALGEVGIDFKEDEKEHEKQIGTFEKIVKLSFELNKPLIIHSRKAEKEIIDILEKHNAKKVIMHCFSGKLSLAKRIIEKKWFLTIPASVKNSEHFQKVIEIAPIEQLFCETDSPYLHPDKKWPNEPANVIESYKKIAEIKKMKIEEVRDKIFKNYERLFV